MSEFSDILTGRIRLTRLAGTSISALGQPINTETEVYASLPVRFEAIKGGIRMMAAGQQKVAEYKFFADYDRDIRENDLFYALSGISGLTQGQVTFVDQVCDLAGATHHLECEVLDL
jgi:hypothetical protein